MAKLFHHPSDSAFHFCTDFCGTITPADLLDQSPQEYNNPHGALTLEIIRAALENLVSFQREEERKALLDCAQQNGDLDATEVNYNTDEEDSGEDNEDQEESGNSEGSEQGDEGQDIMRQENQGSATSEEEEEEGRDDQLDEEDDERLTEECVVGWTSLYGADIDGSATPDENRESSDGHISDSQVSNTHYDDVEGSDGDENIGHSNDISELDDERNSEDEFWSDNSPPRPIISNDEPEDLFTQYQRILPVTEFSGPPPPLPDSAIYVDPGFNMSPGLYEIIKPLTSTSSRKSGLDCDLVIARSAIGRYRDYGMAKGDVCCIKIYHRTGGTRREREGHMDQWKNEVIAFQRIAEAARRDKFGFLFLMSLDASLRDESRCFLIMELMEKDLRDVLKHGDLPQVEPERSNEIRRILAQVTVAIATLHSIGIIHRDLKPENVLVQANGNIKVSDFGLSRTSYYSDPCVPGRDYAHYSCGTFPFIAPENYINPSTRYGMEVDYWALGALFFEVESRGHEPIFENDRQYMAWCRLVTRGGSMMERRQFFEFADLSSLAFLVISGLMHPTPSERSDLAYLLSHPYFKVDGVSEFYNLGLRARIRDEEWVPPKAMAGTARYYRPYPIDYTISGWINPRGAFYPWP
ncbi:kinase-like domain-containing protein [Crassisporium funariophilum]|nr:kinase-like domain-containing protein [Crassisporium funariophilum]